MDNHKHKRDDIIGLSRRRSMYRHNETIINAGFTTFNLDTSPQEIYDWMVKELHRMGCTDERLGKNARVDKLVEKLKEMI